MKAPKGLAPRCDGGGRAVSLLINGQEGRLEKGTTYYTLDPYDLLDVILQNQLSGDDWKVYLSGAHPSVAISESRNISIKSLHRLNAWERSGKPRAEDARSAAAASLAYQLWGIQSRLGITPGAGFTSAVAKLAPSLRKFKRHKGDDIWCKDILARGGRNEVFCQQTSESVKVWDLRSAYAGAYKGGIPGAFLRRSATLPDSGDSFSAKVVVRIPRGEFVPAMPYRRERDGKLLFPVGRWETWACGPEVRLLESLGMIERVEEVRLYGWVDPYQDMVERLWAARQSGDDLANDYAKLVLVSGYGVLASWPAYPIWYLRPFSPPPDGVQIDADTPELMQVMESPKVQLAHGMAGAWIASKIRARVSATLREAGQPFYCAVDSVTLPAEMELPTGGTPGEWQEKQSLNGGSWKAQGVFSLGGGAYQRAAGVESDLATDWLAGNVVETVRKSSGKMTLATGICHRELVKLSFRMDRDLGRDKVKGSPWTIPRRIEDAEKLAPQDRATVEMESSDDLAWRMFPSGLNSEGERIPMHPKWKGKKK